MSEEIQRLLDRAAIQDVMLRYCRGVDRQCWELAKRAFFEDATDHHADFKGAIADFFDWIIPIHAQVARSTHFLGNCLIEFASGTVAVVETAFIASLELGPESQGHRKMFETAGDNPDARIKTDVLGRYVDRFEKRGGEWRIAARQVVFDSTHAQQASGSLEGKTQWVLGTRNSEDPIFLARKAAGLKD